jgi:3-phenylpropionate/cinnamic acid dioxygenase small subunit
MARKVTLEDRAEVQDVLARYCWHVDEGDSDAWADLWTEDGVFAGVTRDPLRGREALKMVPGWSLSGGCRHKLVNLIIEYGDNTDEIVVRCYNFVSSWLDDAKFNSFAVARYHLVRRGDTWKIKSNRVRMLLPKGYDPNGYPEGFPYPANQPTTKFPPID